GLDARGLVQDGFDLQVDLDLVADQEAAALQRAVPMQAEVLTVLYGLRAGGRSPVAERIDGAPGGVSLQRNRPLDASHGQGAGDGVLVFARLADRGALKDDFRIPLDVEKVDAPQVIVPDRNPGVDR